MMFFHERKFQLLPQETQDEINLSINRYRTNLESSNNMKVDEINERVKYHRKYLIDNHWYVFKFREEEAILDQVIAKRLGK